MQVNPREMRSQLERKFKNKLLEIVEMKCTSDNLYGLSAYFHYSVSLFLYMYVLIGTERFVYINKLYINTKK